MTKLKQRSIISGTLILLLANGCSLKSPDSSVHRRTEPEILSTSQKPNLNNPPEVDQETFIPNTDTDIQTKDSWQYLISLFSIPEEDNPRIDEAVAWYLAHPKYIETIQARAEPFLYAIIKEVEEKGLPGEFALLPAIESGFQPDAYSHAHAAGLWQFIPSTGKNYGLKQNWWYDGRRDIYASTEAATSYLQNLGELFDKDWLLALASYNAGEGNVGRAVKRNISKEKATDFWALDLPTETERYVPKLLALAKIFANAEYYGVDLKTLEHKPTFSAVNIGSQLDLSLAAKLSDTSLNELFQLNPGYNRTYTPPEGPHRILIPIDKVEIFEHNLASIPNQERVQWQHHKVMSGDSLNSIARRYKTQTQVISDVNHLSKNAMPVGTSLLIPLAHDKISNNPFIQANQLAPTIQAKTKENRPKPSKIKYPSYKVKAGDSLTSIARKLKVRSKEIALWNNLKVNAPLKLGKTLLIKKNTQVAQKNAKATQKNSKVKQKSAKRKPANKPVRYTVRSGDSLSTISEKFNVRVADLRKWNKKSLGKSLKPGQTLTVDTTHPST
ncbi:MAG: LysM peptidoglycan-binding domain-containing protein [Methylococcaceae bacterium]|nr:LysM peptidoglycan-binding domain-containing protein [Methylococcaceae bacterium]